ncbi:MAG: hypothetical protein VX100_04405 [Pseudomonadota bacterium]|nr:hypothetical protein [Pseudomonadota bacterium]
MELLVSVLVYQKARDEGRKDPAIQDYEWAEENLSYFESHKCELGFCDSNEPRHSHFD